MHASVSRNFLFEQNIFVFQSHVVSAFEQSLAHMTSRLSQLNSSADQKVEYNERCKQLNLF